MRISLDSTLIAPGSTTASGRTKSHGIRSIVSGSVGNAIEFYDWYVYSSFALYFAPVLFPAGNQTVQLLYAAGVFAIGFLMRPLGAWFFGVYADRRGRKAALLLSVLSMSIGSLMIGLLPGYATIGIAAPVLLIVARLIQGISSGGEFPSSTTYLSETAPVESRGFYSSFVYATLGLGQLMALGSLVILQQFILTQEQLQSWGWRIPFFIGAGLATVAMWMRRNMHETEQFSQTSTKPKTQKTSLILLVKHWRECLQVVGLTLGSTVFYFTITTYVQKFLVNTAGFDKSTATLTSTMGLILFTCLQPPFGALSDRVGRRPMLIAFGILGALSIVPLFQWLATAKTPTEAIVPIALGVIIFSLYSSVSAAVKAELFPVAIRTLGVGLPYSITVSVFGGTVEYVALWLKYIGHESLFFWYVALCTGITLVCVMFMRDTKKHSRIEIV